MNVATRFLNSERERIKLELNRISMDSDAALFDEYQRRLDLVDQLLPQAVTPEAAIAAAEQKRQDTEMLLMELVDANRTDVNDTLAANLSIDHDYLVGLINRMDAAIASEMFHTPLFEMPRWW